MKSAKTLVILAFLVSFAAISSTAAAKNTNRTNARIAKLEAALASLQSEIAQLKAQNSRSAVDPQQIQAMVSKAVDDQKQEMGVPKWVENMKIKGDFRYRHEYIDDKAAAKNRDRDRIRFRIGVYGKVNDETDFGIRLASGNSEAAYGTNQDLSGGFSSKKIWLDLAYVNYRPVFLENTSILLGKFKNPLYKVGNSDLLFDSDVNPEGGALKWSKQLNDDFSVFANLGAFWVQERATDADTSLWALQAGLKHKLDSLENGYIAGGGGYYNYGNVKGNTALGTSSTNFRGNSSTSGLYDCDFDLVQGFGEIGFTVDERPVRVFADYITNTSAASNQDSAYLLGAIYGKCKKQGDWNIAYNYRDVESDAILGALAEATFAGGGTDVKGHTFWFNYQISKNFQFGVGLFSGDRTRSGATKAHNTVLVDLKYKF